MRVSYIGGPRDGQQETLADPPERFWANYPNGDRCLYAVRRFTGDAAAEGKADGFHKVYAPTDMTMERFEELVDRLPGRK